MIRNASHIAVREAMTPTVRACFAEDEVASALKQMQQAHVRRLPVLDASAHLAGILSIDDIAARAVGEQGGVSSAEFASAFRQICSQPARKPNGEDLFAHS